jgi:hypothetical protein
MGLEVELLELGLARLVPGHPCSKINVVEDDEGDEGKWKLKGLTVMLKLLLKMLLLMLLLMLL